MIPLETPDVANILSKNFTLRVVNFFGHCINIAGKYSQQKTSFTKLHEEEEEVEEEPFAFYLKNKTKSTEKVLPFLLFFFTCIYYSSMETWDQCNFSLMLSCIRNKFICKLQPKKIHPEVNRITEFIMLYNKTNLEIPNS